MTDQPKALRVATKLDEDFSLDRVTTSVPYAARLLREQHAKIEQLRAAVLAEREACAQLCEDDGLLWGQRYAAAIRERGER